jgi:2-polyprenyl-3-methyl-5-hydroxy-6-metoxy-1,4-benzoquinol methylase
MNQKANNRKQIICSLLPEESEKLMDVGCGPILPSYPYAEKAKQVTCLDWKLKRIEPIPSNIKCVEGDFTKVDLPESSYDTIIASDVFEHILLEQESAFIKKCVSLLKPGGHLILSVPHKGTFAWLDPYHVKPTVHRLLWHLGLYKQLHNGSCDIRKSHKHYTVEEITEKFKPLELLQVNYWGYFFDPLMSWAIALSKGSRRVPGYEWLEQGWAKEIKSDYGKQSFNVALKFYKPPISENV